MTDIARIIAVVILLAIIAFVGLTAIVGALVENGKATRQEGILKCSRTYPLADCQKAINQIGDP